MFGVGPGRGIAFIFFLSGIFVIILSFFIFKSKSIRQLDLHPTMNTKEGADLKVV
jgi:hypothetical protein